MTLGIDVSPLFSEMVMARLVGKGSGLRADAMGGFHGGLMPWGIDLEWMDLDGLFYRKSMNIGFFVGQDLWVYYILGNFRRRSGQWINSARFGT